MNETMRTTHVFSHRERGQRSEQVPLLSHWRTQKGPLLCVFWGIWVLGDESSFYFLGSLSGQMNSCLCCLMMMSNMDDAKSGPGGPRSRRRTGCLRSRLCGGLACRRSGSSSPKRAEQFNSLRRHQANCLCLIFVLRLVVLRFIFFVFSIPS